MIAKAEAIDYQSACLMCGFKKSELKWRSLLIGFDEGSNTPNVQRCERHSHSVCSHCSEHGSCPICGSALIH